MTLDPHMTQGMQICNVCRCSYIQILEIICIRCYLIEQSLKD